MKEANTPGWVRLALWPGTSRASCALVALSAAVMAAALALTAHGLFTVRFLLALLFLASSAWSWLAMRWMDRRDQWPT